MKPFIILSFFCIFSISSFGQAVKYSINGGMNYSFFTMSSFETESDGSSYAWQYNATEKETESTGKFGFYLNNNFTFPINKFLAFQTGFGLSVNNVDLKTGYSYPGILLRYCKSLRL